MENLWRCYSDIAHHGFIFYRRLALVNEPARLLGGRGDAPCASTIDLVFRAAADYRAAGRARCGIFRSDRDYVREAGASFAELCATNRPTLRRLPH